MGDLLESLLTRPARAAVHASIVDWWAARESDAPVALGFVALRPATSYRLLDGTEVLAECTASAEGTAEVTIPVSGVRTLRLVPVDGAAS